MRLSAQRSPPSLPPNCVTRLNPRETAGQRTRERVTQPCVTPTETEPGYAAVRNPPLSESPQVKDLKAACGKGYATLPKTEPVFPRDRERSNQA